MGKNYERLYRVEMLRYAISKRGIAGSVSLVLKIMQHHFGRRCYKVFVLTPSDVINSVLGEVPGYKIKMISSYNVIDPSLKEKLIQYRHRGYISWDPEEILKKGACLWIGYLDGELSSLAWTRAGDKVQPYFFPMTSESALISHCVTLPKYRRHGLYTASLVQIVRALIDKNFKRIYVECNDWNMVSERGIRCVGFHFIGVGKSKKGDRFIWQQKA